MHPSQTGGKTHLKKRGRGGKFEQMQQTCLTFSNGQLFYSHNKHSGMNKNSNNYPSYNSTACYEETMAEPAFFA